VILGNLAGRKITLKEIHRFATGPTTVRGSLRWDILKFYDEIKTGLRKVKAEVGAPSGISVDSWGVDYALMSQSEPLLGLPFHYRDSRTDHSFQKFLECAGRDLIFAETGIQFMQINTLYQLYDDVLSRPRLLEQADHFLPIADYLHFLLSGTAAAEISVASTTQIFNPATDLWSKPLVAKLGAPATLFPDVAKSGTLLGQCTNEIAQETGLGRCRVYATCSHDTGAAVAGVPASGDHWAFISSGTWSLLGVEVNRPIINKESLQANFTNEIGFAGNIRFLKNILGLWLLQETKRGLADRGLDLDYATLDREASTSLPLRSIVNPNHNEFLKPGKMIEKIQSFCQRSGQPIPESPGALARCTLESLALSYACQIEVIQKSFGQAVNLIHVVGGGSKSRLLNQFTADAAGLPVLAGPVEATALGNLLIQAVATGELGSQADIREVVRNSFEIESFSPRNRDPWIEALNRYKSLEQ
jgi:rhamnulokinase